jgi:hypothetical protein
MAKDTTAMIKYNIILISGFRNCIKPLQGGRLVQFYAQPVGRCDYLIHFLIG